MSLFIVMNILLSRVKHIKHWKYNQSQKQVSEYLLPLTIRKRHQRMASERFDTQRIQEEGQTDRHEQCVYLDWSRASLVIFRL